MTEEVVILEKKGAVATLILNRPAKKNSLNGAMLAALSGHLRELAQSDDIRAAVIRGAGGQSFSSGFDIGEIPTEINGSAGAVPEGNPLDMGFTAIERHPYPVIAMIEGYALGAGCELAITCDIRVAAQGARMGIPPSRLGVVYDPAGMQKFINVLGLANAKEAFFTGRFYEMDRAREMGMVNYVVPPDEIHSFTYALAEEIAGNAPLALKGHKLIFNRLLHYQGVSAADRPAIEEMIRAALESEDLKEGAAAFFTRTKPRFQGR